MRYKDLIRKLVATSSTEDMEKLTDMTDDFVEKVRERSPQMADDFVGSINSEFSYFLDQETAKKIIDKMQNENRERPTGEKWDKQTALKAFADAGHPTGNDRYSENGVYYAMNMVYSDFYPMYGEDVKKYADHAFLFLNDKDYQGKCSKEKWYAKKFA